MTEQAKLFYAAKFFPWLLPRFGVMCIEAILNNRRKP